ncbi:MAG: hypothetical protein AAGJ93_13785 [Bacteroidota bacterium]
MRLKIATEEYEYILETTFAWLAAMGMLIYGVAKYVQFDGAAAVDTPVSELTGMQLMWAFYGYSKIFILIIGALEVTGGLLLLFPKTRILGGLICTTILTNIILQDIFYEVNSGALRAAMIYQGAIIGIFIIRREAIIAAIRIITIPLGFSPKGQRKWILLFYTLVLFTLLRWLEFKICTG